MRLVDMTNCVLIVVSETLSSQSSHVMLTQVKLADPIPFLRGDLPIMALSTIA